MRRHEVLASPESLDASFGGSSQQRSRPVNDLSARSAMVREGFDEAVSIEHGGSYFLPERGLCLASGAPGTRDRPRSDQRPYTHVLRLTGLARRSSAASRAHQARP